MYRIYKIASNTVVDFAAEELKKYLRMMMPRCGEIEIKYDPAAKDGFRLGLMSDFLLDTSEADDVYLDDIVHIDTDAEGGIIAGSNARSVLLAVYRYLRLNGCRWLFPGIDGEYIPVKNIEPQKYHKMASCRYRGQCNEGAEYQPNMMETIDFTPKLGMNIFMIEFDNPKVYYDSYYMHLGNEANREAEPVTPETVLQWKRQCEAEIAKRGLQHHDMGHGWTADPFGLDSTDGWVKTKRTYSEEQLKYTAMLGGKRGLYRDIEINTQFCMSNPEARAIVTKSVCDYAENATNVDYLHVWLADGERNHCECDECRKMIPSDWYMVLMNDIDAELTARGLATRIVFCCYVDTSWAPEKIKLNNPDRFSVNVGVITRSYTQPISQNIDYDKIEIGEFKLNAYESPKSVEEYLVHARNWRKMCGVRAMVYEYHFWKHQYRYLSATDFARLLHDDVVGYSANGIDGVIQDGSQRSFFPNGLPFYVYGETLFDTSLSADELIEDYMRAAYGEDYKTVIGFFDKLGELCDPKFLYNNISYNGGTGDYHDPELAKKLRSIATLADEFRGFVEEHKNMPKRAQTVSMRLLRHYLDYVKGLSNVLVLMAFGADKEAEEAFARFIVETGKKELEIERYIDMYILRNSFAEILRKQKKSVTAQ